MHAFHDTRDPEYRSPFGAVTAGTEISLALTTDGSASEATLRIWIDSDGERYLPMAKSYREEGGYRFHATISRDVPGIVWYSFIVRGTDEWGNETTVYVGPEEGKHGGRSALYDRQLSSFQITVYRERKLPDWYKNAVFYQIFPDRFFRGEEESPTERAAREETFFRLHPHGIRRVIVPEWDKVPEYKRSETGAVTEWEFYGGTLDGIREKLPYLADLGITALYLNPIFEALSNHRYDTGDYFRVDPLLGGDEAFDRLIAAANGYGISIMLDGVFNHTGWDSLYFNRFGNYPSTGAYESADSPYREWFTFDDSPVGYDAWWGIPDLPAVNEMTESYREFIYGGGDSVVRHYLRKGAKAWRLDVADELPDEFIEGLKQAAVETDPDAIVIGEVWEDASNKVSYGKLRRYLLGHELDTAMNYPLRAAVHEFLLGTSDAYALAETVLSLMENYPPTAFYGAFNLMGSHDRARSLTVMGGVPDADSLTEAERRAYRLSDEQRELAVKRFRLMTVLQMTLPGVPCVYYGDEAGMEGYSDPFNRATYPWGKEDGETMAIVRDAIRLRKSDPVFTDGGLRPFAADSDVFGFERFDAERKGNVTVLINRNREETRYVRLDGGLTVSVAPLSYAIVREN